MFQQSRYASGLSQQKVADLMKVNKSTVQNWENGSSVPSFDKLIEWFKALGLPMYPYLMKLAYPKELASVTTDSDISDIRKGLNKLVTELDDFHARELLYILDGTHGSSPTGTLDMASTYLHLPLTWKCITARSIVDAYEMFEKAPASIEISYPLCNGVIADIKNKDTKYFNNINRIQRNQFGFYIHLRH